MSAAPAPVAAELFPAGAWRVDPARSVVGFHVRHLRVARVRGRFHEFTGQIEAGSRLRIVGSVEVASLDTGDRVRDERLLDPSMFDAARHPRIEYQANAATPEDGRWRIAGALTICGVTRPLDLHAKAAPRADGSILVAARGQLSRRDFGLQWNALVEAGTLVVADQVAVTVDAVVVPA